MDGSQVTGRRQHRLTKRDRTGPTAAQLRRAVIRALAVPTALLLLAACSSDPKGRIIPIRAASPTVSATTTATTTDATPAPTATSSATAGKQSNSAKPKATKPAAAKGPSRITDRKSLALAAVEERVVYLSVPNGHLLSVDGNGKVSMSGTA